MAREGRKILKTAVKMLLRLIRYIWNRRKNFCLRLYWHYSCRSEPSRLESETDGIVKIEYRLVPRIASIRIVLYRTALCNKVHIPYHTVTVRVSRYTVSQNTVPLD